MKYHIHPTKGKERCRDNSGYCPYEPIVGESTTRDRKRYALGFTEASTLFNSKMLKEDNKPQHNEDFWGVYNFIRTHWDNKEASWRREEANKETYQGLLLLVAQHFPEEEDYRRLKNFGDFRAQPKESKKKYSLWIDRLREKKYSIILGREVQVLDLYYKHFIELQEKHLGVAKCKNKAVFMNVMSTYLARMAGGCELEVEVTQKLDNLFKDAGFTTTPAPLSDEPNDVDAIIKDANGNELCRVSIKTLGALTEESIQEFYQSKKDKKRRPHLYCGVKEKGGDLLFYSPTSKKANKWVKSDKVLRALQRRESGKA